ncbi:DNA repair protein RecN [Azovibrio restrictus]|uniref:DNA repair protein RecN n=1 Tax=Azovibrio restrictus TaxID=146938 RepID=UPI0026E9E72B|nr:DNA repair protein RecN [Azovibrio restrictus]MDD3482030.1 DNA repair protein RecN [Azovibrio restrictus]
MLLHLAIRDFVIVDRLELEFARGFAALTGETGAGKSILIDALALALGERADPGVVRSGREKAEVAATFDVEALPPVRQWLAAQDLEDEGQLILRRVVDSGGRSRAYINGSACTVQQLREVGEYLVDIHGQHAHQSLLRADAQRQLLDGHGGLLELAREVSGAWKSWRQLESALEAARAGSEASARERDMLAWQLQELEQLGFSAPEWVELEAEQRRLAHAASLIEGAQFALGALVEGEGACESLVAGVADRLQDMARVDEELEAAAGMLQSVQAEISEVVSILRRYSDRVDLDPARLAEVERRMDAVLGLARKHRVEPEQLPELQQQWRVRLDGLQEAADVEGLADKAAAAADTYRQLAARLSAGRQRVAQELGAAVSAQMRDLALGSGRFEVALLPLEGGAAQGLEQVEFRVAGLAANEARSLAKVASGGELSRISLALQVVTSRNASVPTLIFDEVDVGIGGGVAEIVGRLLHQLGAERQVLCVTHLPQVAARADWHWQVKKASRDGVVTSRIEALEHIQRVEELARMLGGVEITETTRSHARELLQGA